MTKTQHYRIFSPLRFIERLSSMAYHRLFGVLVVLLIAFAQMYFALSIAFPQHGVVGVIGVENTWEQWANSLYFSVVTATTVGYGDMTPLGLSRAFAAAEAMLGFAVLALFVSKIVSQKQEIALFNVHKLAFQNAFSATREGFFILRRDCDVLISEAQSTGGLSEHGYSNFLVLLQKGHVLLHDVRDFYDDFDWYNLDPRRETLLLEAVHRTFQHVQSLYCVLDERGIAWRDHEELAREREQLRETGAETLRHWQKHASPTNEMWFTRIRGVLETLRKD